jgi:cbb3-type cytochrome oxidase subunit 3
MSMDLQTQIQIAATVVSFALFVVIVWWALGASRRERFAKDAHAPFALPDDLPTPAIPDGKDSA